MARPTVSAGTLALGGTIASSPRITVVSGAKFDVSAVTSGPSYDGAHFSLVSGQTLRGNGTVVGFADVAAGATISPGESVGTLYTDSVGFTAAGSIYNAEIDLGSNFGADLLNVTGAVSLNGSTLNLSVLNPAVPGTPLTFVIIQNDGDGVTGDPISGVFGTVSIPVGFSATVDYAFNGIDALGRIGDGNDVAVTLTAVVPEPSAITLYLLSLTTIGMRQSGHCRRQRRRRW